MLLEQIDRNLSTYNSVDGKSNDATELTPRGIPSRRRESTSSYGVEERGRSEPISSPSPALEATCTVWPMTCSIINTIRSSRTSPSQASSLPDQNRERAAFKYLNPPWFSFHLRVAPNLTLTVPSCNMRHSDHVLGPCISLKGQNLASCIKSRDE